MSSSSPIARIGPDSPRSGPYSDAFKADAVAKARASSIAQVSRELGVTRNALSAWMNAAEPPSLPLVDAVRSGNQRQYLMAVRDELAAKIADGMAPRDLPPNIRLLNETIRSLAELDARDREESEDAESAPDEDLDPEDL